jgi:small subunit ribosomal protein S4
MGSIKKIRKKYSKPSHPWRIARIDEENALCKEYGIPKKTEIWKTISKLESFKNQAKKLAAITTTQATKEKDNLYLKLQSYNFIKKGDTSDAVLGITLKDILNRRLQTIVFKKGLTKSMKQARQLINHRHILVNNNIISSPSYIVRVSEENNIEISPKSPFYDTNHAERIKEATKRVAKKVEKQPAFRRGRRK